MPRGRKSSPKPPVAASQAGVFVPVAPTALGERARAKWNAIVPLIANQVQLKDVDADALRQYCEAAVLREKAVAELEDAPLLMLNPNGSAFMNPLMKIIKEQDALMARMSERFGLDPASRRRLMIETAKADTAFAEFLKGGRARAKPELAAD